MINGKLTCAKALSKPSVAAGGGIAFPPVYLAGLLHRSRGINSGNKMRNPPTSTIELETVRVQRRQCRGSFHHQLKGFSHC